MECDKLRSVLDDKTAECDATTNREFELMEASKWKRESNHIEPLFS